MVSEEYLGGEAMAFPFFFDLEGDGFNFFGGEDGVATREGGWSGCLAGDIATPDVATDREANVFDGEESSDLGRGKLGWLGNVSDEVV